MDQQDTVFSRVVSALSMLGFAAVTGFAIYAWDSLSDGEWIALLSAAWLLFVVGTLPHLPKPASATSRGIVNAAFVLTTIFALLTLQLARVQVFSSDDITHRIGRDEASDETLGNPRLVRADLTSSRGAILDRDGEVIAESNSAVGSIERIYPNPATAYVAGYYSPLLYGKSGLEASHDDELRGAAGGNPIEETLDDLLGREAEGNDLVLTLDATLQELAHNLLAGRPGAVVVINVQTGAVITLASNPNYDPNQLDVLTEGDRDAAEAYWAILTDDPSRPLLLRATQGLFTPGSTFKVVTAAAAVDVGHAGPDTVYRDDGSLNVDGHIIVEPNRPDDSIDEWTLADGIAFSLNVVLAQVGLDLGADRLRDYARRFGFDKNVPFELPVATSRVASSDDFLESSPALADTAFGQGQLQVAPLLMAMVVGAVANAGTLMEPYIVERVTDPDGETHEQHDPEVWNRPISAESADQVEGMMVNAVVNGSVGGAAVPGFVVGGKTGTAETSQDEPHSWFIGFIGDSEPKYAVAVVLEHGGVGTAQSVTIGREMLAAAMSED
ncbi:MAG: peptidoglycan D,D-transpeptidase FtsI family protein [Thermomicrobiales bacterium]